MITADKITRVQSKIKKLLLEVAKEENVEITFGNCQYNAAYYKSAMTVTSKEKSEKVENIFITLSKRMGFTQNIIGMTFDAKSCGKVTITDIQTKNRKYPIIGKSDTGKGYKFTTDQVKNYLGGDKLINRNSNLDKLLGK